MRSSIGLGSTLAPSELVRQALVDQNELAGGEGCSSPACVATFPPKSLGQAARVRVFCLGAFHVTVDGVPVENWRLGKVRSLFQYLANHRNRPIGRDRLIEVLWPNPDASTPSISLKVTVHALRRTLARVGDGALAQAVQAHAAGYRLAATDLWLDVEEFERCFALGRRLEEQARESEALGFYTAAADLYRGDFLEESWDDWVVFRREGLKDQHLFVLARLADAALASADYHGCILRCQQLLAADRCREDTYRTLMVCHSRLGQRGRVRSWYDLCVRTLRAELDAAPEPETQRLYLLALRGEA